METTRIFLALVTFERTDRSNEILPPEGQGASGWMVVAASNEDQVTRFLREDLALWRLRLLEVDKVREIDLETDPPSFDEHLLENVREWEPGCRTVWGTIHVYLHDEEA